MGAEISFDTHRFVKNLTAAGFTETQAETLANEQIRLIEGNLATKADVAAIKSDLEVQIRKVKSDLEVQIQSVKSDLMKWMVGAMTAQTGLLVGLILGLPRLF